MANEDDDDTSRALRIATRNSEVLNAIHRLDQRFYEHCKEDTIRFETINSMLTQIDKKVDIRFTEDDTKEEIETKNETSKKSSMALKITMCSAIGGMVVTLVSKIFF